MKRSTQVTLVLTAVAGLGAGAYALAGNSGCRQSAAPPAPGDAPQSCQSSHGHSSGHSFFHSGGAGTTSAGGSGESSTGGATSHGGFGATGHGMAGGE